LKNKNSKLVISLLVALYASLVAPSLPNNVILFFDTVIGKLLFVFLIAYVASQDAQVAIMLAVAFVVTLTIINHRRTEQFSIEGFNTCTGESVDSSEVTDETNCSTGCLNACDNLRQCMRHKYVYIAGHENGREKLSDKVTSLINELTTLKEQRDKLKKEHDELREANNAPTSDSLRNLAKIRSQIINKKFNLDMLESIRINKEWTWNTISTDDTVDNSADPIENFVSNIDEDDKDDVPDIPLPADNLTGDTTKFYSPV